MHFIQVSQEERSIFWEVIISNILRGQNFSPLHVVQTGSGVQPAAYPMGSRDSFSEVKRPRREADNSPSTSAEAKNTWIYTSTPYVFMA
jgi:hypothetical protein